MDAENAVVALEAGVFRLGQVVRALRRDHPDLPFSQPYVNSRAREYDGVVSAVSELEFTTYGAALLDPADERARVDAVAEWARRLGLPPATRTVTAYATYCSDWAEAEGEYEGVAVRVWASRTLTDEEAAEWRARQAEQAGAEVSS